MKRLLLAAIAIAIGAAGCASVQLNSYVARDTDLAVYRTYNWAPSDRLATGDPRLDNNPFFRRALQASVDRRLTAKRLERRETGHADLEVRYHARVSQQVDPGTYDKEFGPCDAAECEPFVFDEGTIMIDLVDARTQRLVWRGWTKERIDGVIDNQDRLEERIDKAVFRIIEQFPTKG
jgi:hypothetical protein